MTKLLPGADASPPWSVFSELHHILLALHDHAVFSLFLSTMGKVSQFPLAKEDDPSMHVQSGVFKLILPFVCLGFDQFADEMRLEGVFHLEEAASIDCMVTFGRPL